MKKSLIKVISALIIFTVLIAVIQNTENQSFSKSSSNWTWETKHAENIIRKDEKSLNSWLILYNSWLFQKVEIEDWVNLKWYILSGILYFLYDELELWTTTT